MRVLQLHYTNDVAGRGGGPIAMYRLHRALRDVGVDSWLLCRAKNPAIPHSIAISSSYAERKLEKLLQSATWQLGLSNLHSVSSFRIHKEPAYLNADILNIHGIHGGFFSYLALPSLTRNKAVVYTLHDMWPFTGRCTVSFDCERWKTGCGKCPYPGNQEQKDGTRVEWALKKWVYKRSRLSIVAPSKCRFEEAKASILGRFPIYWIPNGVDTETFSPLDPQQCRSLLGIPYDKKVVMFAAPKVHSFAKGGDLLIRALGTLPRGLRNRVLLLVLGAGGEQLSKGLEIATRDLGYVSDDRLKAIAYSAADIFVSPTRGDTFPLVLQESMACGTPLVSFGVGGVPDLVRAGVTGYLARAEDATDLAHGIMELLESDSMREGIGRQCREIALAEYPIELQVKRYRELYQSLV